MKWKYLKTVSRIAIISDKCVSVQFWHYNINLSKSHIGHVKMRGDTANCIAKARFLKYKWNIPLLYLAEVPLAPFNCYVNNMRPHTTPHSWYTIWKYWFIASTSSVIGLACVDLSHCHKNLHKNRITHNTNSTGCWRWFPGICISAILVISGHTLKPHRISAPFIWFMNKCGNIFPSYRTM